MDQQLQQEPLKTEMDALEKRIMALEEIQKEEQALLTKAIEGNDRQSEQPLLLSIGKRHKEIDSSFERLMEIYSFKLKNWDFANAKGCRLVSIKTCPLLHIGAVFTLDKMLTLAKAKTNSSI